MRKTSALRKVAETLDAVELDPRHYTVDFENDKVRVVRIKYGPNERSVMHEHGDGVAVFLTNQKSSFTYPDGRTEVIAGKAGETRWMKAFQHLPENLANDPMELIYIEVKK